MEHLGYLPWEDLELGMTADYWLGYLVDCTACLLALMEQIDLVGYQYLAVSLAKALNQEHCLLVLLLSLANLKYLASWVYLGNLNLACLDLVDLNWVDYLWVDYCLGS